MNAVLEQRGLPEARARWQPWLLLALGLAALYVPTYVSLARSLWREDAYAHGPIILAAFAWLAWRERAALLAPAGRPAIVPGAVALAVGLFLYVGGRTLGLTPIEVASHIPVLAGLVLLIGGFPALRRYAFALAFLLFLIPLPGFVLDAATTPLKSVVSVAVEMLLRLAGYPVERSGVVLSLGDHQMLVADACSGLNSIFSLFALGLLYTHLTGPSSRKRTAVLLAAVLPIAIAANILRVTALVLLTVHFGEEAAQGFLHGFAGMLVFLAALSMLVGLDKLISRKNRGQTTCPAGKNGEDTMAASTHSSPRGKWLVPGLAALAMAGAAVATPVIKPVPGYLPIDLERVLPTSFADWKLDPDTEPVAPTPDVQAKLDLIYNQIVSRTYVNAAGERMMLTVAYGGDQSDALKAHRQEVCYAAQGFEIHGLEHGTTSAAGRTIPVTRMVAVLGERVEPVTYWFTMGDRVVLGRGERLRVQVASGLKGRIPDGMLVRVSSLSQDAPRAYAAQQAFLAALFTPMPEGQAARFVGRAGS